MGSFILTSDLSEPLSKLPSDILLSELPGAWDDPLGSADASSSDTIEESPTAHNGGRTDASQRRFDKITQIRDPKERVDAMKTHRILQLIAHEQFTVFDLVRTLLSCNIFKRFATNFKQAAYDEDEARTLHAILKHKRRQTGTILECLLPELEKQMESIGNIEGLAAVGPSAFEISETEKMPELETLLRSANDKGPDLLRLLCSLTKRGDCCEKSTRLLTLLGVMAYTRHKIKSNALQLRVGVHLHASGTRRHVIDLLHNMGVCCSYEVITGMIKEISKRAADRIAAIAERATVITAYDNFEYTVGVRQERVDDNSAFKSVTTGLAFDGLYIPSGGLTQSMLDSNFKLTVPNPVQDFCFC